MNTADLVPVANAINDFPAIARVLTPAIAAPENNDIEYEFSGTVRRLGTSVDGTISDLHDNAARCRTGEHEIFIVYAGKVAVGLSWITGRGKTPESVEDQSAPNVSGFIIHPYRRNGYGMQSLLQRLKIVEAHFGDTAWTLVDKKNEASTQMVTQAGFKQMPADKSVKPNYNLFVYQHSIRD